MSIYLRYSHFGSLGETLAVSEELRRENVLTCPLSFQLQEVNRHPWVTAGSKTELELEAPMMEVVQTHIIPTEEFIDDDVLRAMNSLGCFKDKEKLKTELLQPQHNTGKEK